MTISMRKFMSLNDKANYQKQKSLNSYSFEFRHSISCQKLLNSVGLQPLLFFYQSCTVFCADGTGKVARICHDSCHLARPRTAPVVTLMSDTKLSPLPFGTVLGYAPGQVAAYSSDYKTADPKELPDRHSYRNYIDGIYTGYKWQCVEFARRWLLMNRGYVFDDIAMAYDIFRLNSVRVVATDERLPLHSFTNGSLRHPQPGCMLIWSEGGEFQVTGHVAIITDVFPDKILIAEQNVGHQYWPQGRHYARELPARIADDGSYWIQCSYHNATVLGWVMQTSDNQHAVVFPDPEPELFNLQKLAVPPSATRRSRNAWLNPANPDEDAYIQMNGQRLCSDDKEKYAFIAMSETAQQELKRATNELHALFMHATDYVLQHEELLEHFNIPKVIWPRIHQSWDNRRNQMISGRFDFCMTEHGLKLYEYNADSASCHMEAGKVQGLWAEHYGCDIGEDAGEDLFQSLVDAWKKSAVDGLVHIMLDRDAEETYHALFMRECMKAAGIDSKMIHGLNELRWGSDGDVLDADGMPIRWVWKTWAWETALDQLREELDEEAQMQALQSPKGSHPRLMDVLFRPQTMVFEPLWTLITSNKAILPILWQMFPDHPYLLNSRFDLSDDLKKAGYVVKPIAGRCGHNITLFAAGDAMLSGTDGRFDDQLQIYQALCALPELGGHKVQMSSFSAGGTYAGACVRTDASLIITKDSDIMPLRVLQDRDFLPD